MYIVKNVHPILPEKEKYEMNQHFLEVINKIFEKYKNLEESK